MDPNSPATPPTPEPTPAPTPTPEQASPQQPLPAQPLPPTPQDPQQPQQPQLPPKKPNKGIIFAIVGGALLIILLIIGIVMAVNAMNKEDGTDSNRTSDSSKTEDTDKDKETTTEPSASAITAKAPIDLRISCIGGSTTNAGAFAKPYRYVVYENNNPGTAEREVEKWDMYAVGSNDQSISVDDRSDPSELNVVVCLDRDDSTAVKTMSCELNRSASMQPTDSTVADYYSVKYKMTLYNAQSGEKVKELAAINGPATECPSGKYYSPESPNIYGDPDDTELNERLEEFDRL